MNCATRSNANSVFCPSTQVDIGSLYPQWMASQQPNSSLSPFSLLYVPGPLPSSTSSFLFCPHVFPPLDLCWLLCSCPRCWNVAGNRAAFQSDGWDLLSALREREEQVFPFLTVRLQSGVLWWSVDWLKSLTFCLSGDLFPKNRSVWGDWGSPMYISCELVVFAGFKCCVDHYMVWLNWRNIAHWKQFLNSKSTCLFFQGLSTTSLSLSRAFAPFEIWSSEDCNILFQAL